MAIDLEKDTLLTVAQAAAYLKERTGTKPHVSAIYRWMMAKPGKPKLEWIRIGGRRYTSVEALQRFADAPTQDEELGKPATRQPRTTRQQEREQEKARRQVDEILGRKR